MEIIESKTAVKHGYGSDKYRWVSGLTQRERDAVKSFGLVFFRVPKRHWTQSGYKVVVYRNGRWDAREPTEAELRRIKAKLQRAKAKARARG
ncbi:MAG: hypothetical protein M0R06_08295 [Sphaerochaeta sp.]|jgi:hypothetical protein|nr:hypothetical protein [Sphaerochaeta sp.]